MSTPVKTFSEWLLSEPIGIATFSCVFACTAESVISSLRTLMIRKTLEDQSKLTFNHFSGNIEYNQNINNNKANRELLLNQSNCVNRDQTPSLDSKLNCKNLEYFDYISLPHIGFTFLAMMIHLLLSFFMIYLVYLFLSRMKMVPRQTQQQYQDSLVQQQQ